MIRPYWFADSMGYKLHVMRNGRTLCGIAHSVWARPEKITSYGLCRSCERSAAKRAREGNPVALEGYFCKVGNKRIWREDHG